MAILQEENIWLGGWTGRHQDGCLDRLMGVDGQTDTGLMRVDRRGKWGGSDTGVMRTDKCWGDGNGQKDTGSHRR